MNLWKFLGGNGNFHHAWQLTNQVQAEFKQNYDLQIFLSEVLLFLRKSEIIAQNFSPKKVEALKN